jgi:hypothetical protein
MSMTPELTHFTAQQLLRLDQDAAALTAFLQQQGTGPEVARHLATVSRLHAATRAALQAPLPLTRKER